MSPFVTVSQEALKRHEIPSRDQIDEALREGRRQAELARRRIQTPPSLGGLRFRNPSWRG